MSVISQQSVKNRLLRALPDAFFAKIQPFLARVDLPMRFSLVDADQPTQHLYFLESGLGSVVASSTDSESIEVGHIGREGVSGAHLFLKTSTTPTRTFMQVAGDGILVPADRFLAMQESEPAVRDMFLRYVHCCELQLAHSALANGRYSINERLARWLLMCHDRLDGDDLALTHKFLATMLGVRRSGVTTEIHVLEGVHAIKATRGKIHILDRGKLEEIAGGSYGIPEAQYDALIGARPLRDSSDSLRAV